MVDAIIWFLIGFIFGGSVFMIFTAALILKGEKDRHT